ncbi:MAG: electron transport complex subunit RsxC [Sulfuricellaceae bacterium]|nr:electron transport complex subunit RsxC [Sulfuricellaceae bacterium]
MKRILHTFHGGIHPPQHKLESTQLPIALAPLPPKLVIPLIQHIGTPAQPLVEPGDLVLKGQVIGQPEGAISAAIHASSSGRVVALEPHAIPHPSGIPQLAVVIEVDGDDRWVEHSPLDYRTAERGELLSRLKAAGVVGLGGAVFPSHVKLDPQQYKLQTLILNGAECEPWISSDDMLMRERAADIVKGIDILRYLLGPQEIIVGIEDNKPEAIAALRSASQGCGIEVAAIPTIYPGGGERQLIKVLTGKEVPVGVRPFNVGVVCTNIATAYSIHRAVNLGEPVISRIVTVTGNVRQPRNFEALVGTPLHHLIALAGGVLPDTKRYLMGGPMMGVPLPSLDVPLVKASNCILALSEQLQAPPPPALPCIRCTRCADACPMDLGPFELYWFACGKNFGKAQEYDLFDCIECACCDYVCPSHIPLVHYFRFAKSEIWAREKEKEAADAARQRHEFRQLRLEREKAEKMAKHAKAAGTAPSDSDAKKAAIQAALERAKAKKAAVVPKNVENLPPQAQHEIDQIEARRAAPHNAEIPNDTDSATSN